MHLLKELINTKWDLSLNPWITLGLQKSISVKSKFFTNFSNKKDPLLKEEFHIKYKNYRNSSSILVMMNILKEIGIILRTHGKELNP